MASQMAPAVFDTTTVDFDVPGGHQYLFRATGSVMKFQGFLALYREAREEGDAKALEDEQALPPLEPTSACRSSEITPSSTSPSRRRASPKPRS
jgi:DNA topoisomerase I